MTSLEKQLDPWGPIASPGGGGGMYQNFNGNLQPLVILKGGPSSLPPPPPHSGSSHD